jgi:hypothetical protein
VGDSPTGVGVSIPVAWVASVAVVNRSTHSITRWPLTFESNFLVALDEPDRRFFVATSNATSIRRSVLRLSPQAVVYPGWRRIHRRVPAGRCRSLQVSSPTPFRGWRTDCRVFRKGQEGIGPLIPCGSGSRRPRHRTVDLCATGLRGQGRDITDAHCTLHHQSQERAEAARLGEILGNQEP